MGLATRDQVHLPCPDRGQSPQSRGSGPCHSTYKRAHEQKFIADEVNT
jgi:hypothetical protein